MWRTPVHKLLSSSLFRILLERFNYLWCKSDVVLNNLNLQESALDDLDLPEKIKAGHISKLTLKIPWKNLYTEPVVAYLDGIYALAVPNVGDLEPAGQGGQHPHPLRGQVHKPVQTFRHLGHTQGAALQTTDSNWKETVIKEAVTQIYKEPPLPSPLLPSLPHLLPGTITGLLTSIGFSILVPELLPKYWNTDIKNPKIL
ncbi:vacuolar protein sorting-associated protein 13C [Elysia marginata]|uniref:Vacuolar protein sorting-associated protein 13C n=1 Tax=Elysia marginata TaxID=1093978 RepID=A0AAV4IUW2_9GAST|nr:vacuolar protein sorting-associated protein 13C [Elysia marginata]